MAKDADGRLEFVSQANLVNIGSGVTQGFVKKKVPGMKQDIST